MALTLVTQNPMLQECDPKSIAVGVIRSAQLGLALDPLLGEAYLVPRWNSKKKQMEASFQKGYRGVLKLIRRTGELSGVRGDVVHANDKFMRTANGDIFHEPIDGERGERKGAYITMYFKDGFVLAHYMPKSEILAIRDRYSEGWKKFPDSSPWNPNNPIAEKWMWIKTVLFQAAHLAPMETEAGQVVVKEAVGEEMPNQDAAMDALSAEIFEGDEPIEMTRTTERLSRTDQLTKQLDNGTRANDAPLDASTPSQAPADSSNVHDAATATSAGTGATSPDLDQRGTLAQRLVVARDYVFAKLAEGDRFVAGKTDGKFKTLEQLVENGTVEELSGMLREINSFANQREALK